jgi:hypothetical protein
MENALLKQELQALRTAVAHHLLTMSSAPLPQTAGLPQVIDLQNWARVLPHPAPSCLAHRPLCSILPCVTSSKSEHALAGFAGMAAWLDCFQLYLSR